mmetsp:Transcript_73332/g.237164  ORF Transcript_73332/g.237164 Transcript_73332/m.237164 type:complete len:221 (-) Transcript_73332:20-682(-)
MPVAPSRGFRAVFSTLSLPLKSSGSTPTDSFFTVVMRMGTLFHLPWAMSSRGSPGTASPSTTGCQPCEARALVESKPFMAPNPTMPMMLCRKPFDLGEASDSETQSAPQSSCASLALRQASWSASFLQPILSIMKFVRSLLVVRDHTSAGGEARTHRWKSPAEPGDTRCVRMIVAPSLWPISVTFRGSPPKAEMCRCTHWRRSCWSMKPRLFVTPEPCSP